MAKAWGISPVSYPRESVYHSGIHTLTATTKCCKRCDGTGIEPDWAAIGRTMRRGRKAAHKSLREVAKRMHVSPSYVSALENGLKPWRIKIQQRYLTAIARVELVS